MDIRIFKHFFDINNFRIFTIQYIWMLSFCLLITDIKQSIANI